MSSSERTDRATALITGASSGIGYQYAGSWPRGATTC